MAHAAHILLSRGLIRECELHPGSYYGAATPAGDERLARLCDEFSSDAQAIRALYADSSGSDECPCCTGEGTGHA